MEPLNAWLADTGDGWLLLDTGMPIASCWKALRRGIEDAGVAWSDIRTVVISHMHPDHVGLAMDAREASGAPIAMHWRDQELLNEFSTTERAEHWNGVALRLAGSPAESIPKVNAAFHLLTVKFPSFAAELPLRGSERFGPWEVIWTPGHSPGHVCLFDRERRALLSGDHILETASPNISWLPDGNPLEAYFGALRELGKLEIDVVLPGHGEPIHQHRSWIERTVAHHEQRLERIQELCAEQPLTAHEITIRLWGEDLPPIHYRFAIFEVLAHLIYLENSGGVTRETREGDAAVFRAAYRAADRRGDAVATRTE